MTTKVIAIAFGISFVTTGPARIAADDVTDEITYQNAVRILKDVDDWNRQAQELASKCKKATTYKEEQRLRTEAEDLLIKSKKSQAEARKLMESIAPSDRPGHVLAHLWLFDDLYRMQTGPDGKSIPPSPRAIIECERHLLHVLKSPDEQAKTRAQFGLLRLYRDTNQLDAAKEMLTIVADKAPEYRLVLAQLAKGSQEKHDVIAAHAQAALEVFSARLKKDASNHEARFGCIACLSLLGRIGETERLINEGAALTTDPELIRAYTLKRVDVFVALFDEKEDDPKSNADERFAILERALKIDPKKYEIHSRMLRLMKDKSIGEKIQKRFQELIDQGHAEPYQRILFPQSDANDKERLKQTEAIERMLNPKRDKQ